MKMIRRYTKLVFVACNMVICKCTFSNAALQRYMQTVALCMHYVRSEKRLKSTFNRYLKEHPVSLVQVRMNSEGPSKACRFC